MKNQTDVESESSAKTEPVIPGDAIRRGRGRPRNPAKPFDDGLTVAFGMPFYMALESPKIINAGTKGHPTDKAVQFNVAFYLDRDRTERMLTSKGWRLMYGNVYPPTRRMYVTHGPYVRLTIVEQKMAGYFKKAMDGKTKDYATWREKFAKSGVALPGDESGMEVLAVPNYVDTAVESA